MTARKFKPVAFRVPEDLDLALSTIAESEGRHKEDLVSGYLDKYLSAFDPKMSDRTRYPLAVRSYYLHESAYTKLDTIAKLHGLSKSHVFRATLLRATGLDGESP